MAKGQKFYTEEFKSSCKLNNSGKSLAELRAHKAYQNQQSWMD
jgi:hypothetical protein